MLELDQDMEEGRRGSKADFAPVQVGCDAEGEFRDTTHDCFVEQRLQDPQEEA